MAKLTPQEFQEKHNRRLKGATEDMEKGVLAVTEAPGKKAAAKEKKMKAKLVESIDNGKWAANVSKISLEEWKSKMVNKGIGRVGQGIDEAADKMVDFAGQLLPHIDRVKAEVDKMPDLTLEDSIQRMTKFTRGMAKFKKK